IVAVAYKADGSGKQFDERGMMNPMMRGMMNENRTSPPGIDVKERMFYEHRERMMNWVQNCEKWMERLREKVETSNMNETTKLRIQERINNVEQQMEQIKLRIQNAKDYEELRGAMRENSKIWINVSKEMRLIACENMIERAKIIIEKLSELANRFESAGLDVTNLRSAIDKATNTLNGIETKIANGQEVTQQDLRKLKFDIQKAFLEAKKLAREYKPAPEIGIAHARVNGSFELNGNMVALVRGNGTLNATGDSVASAKGTVAMVLRGNVSAKGEGDFMIVIHGKGVLSMDGTGSYAYKKCANEKFVTGNFTDSVEITFGC
ncbi:MAG: hypothetical protein ACK401_06030, partial [Archaeoglobaceae archaeon]